MSYQAGTWNVQYGHRPAADYAASVYRRFKRLELRHLALQELEDYAHELRQLAAADGAKLLASDDRRCGLLVAPGVRVGASWSVGTRLRWFTPRGRQVKAPRAVLAELDGGIVGSVHAPVGAWIVGPGGRAWAGPLRRRLAYASFMRRLVKVYRRHPGVPVELWGDWNSTPDARGRWSPEWLRRQVGGVFARPHRNTGHGELDYAIVRGLVPSEVTARARGHSDHRLVSGELRRRRVT